MNVFELVGEELDYYVARVVEDLPTWFTREQIMMVAKAKQYSTDWAHGGPIINRKGIGVLRNGKLMYSNDNKRWRASMILGQDNPPPRVGFDAMGPTPLIAAMRCLVASKFGEEVPNT